MAHSSHDIRNNHWKIEDFTLTEMFLPKQQQISVLLILRKKKIVNSSKI